MTHVDYIYYIKTHSLKTENPLEKKKRKRKKLTVIRVLSPPGARFSICIDVPSPSRDVTPPCGASGRVLKSRGIIHRVAGVNLREVLGTKPIGSSTSEGSASRARGRLRHALEFPLKGTAR
jgi:hypothetical protein